MGGANLEVFKFAVYVFFPVMVMLHYGDPDWYARNVSPYKDKIFPPERNIVKDLPTDQSTLREELAKIRARKLERKMERDRDASTSS